VGTYRNGGRIFFSVEQNKQTSRGRSGSAIEKCRGVWANYLAYRERGRVYLSVQRYGSSCTCLRFALKLWSSKSQACSPPNFGAPNERLIWWGSTVGLEGPKFGRSLAFCLRLSLFLPSKSNTQKIQENFCTSSSTMVDSPDGLLLGVSSTCQNSR
jgi:hypothetical protein